MAHAHDETKFFVVVLKNVTGGVLRRGRKIFAAGQMTQRLSVAIATKINGKRREQQLFAPSGNGNAGDARATIKVYLLNDGAP